MANPFDELDEQSRYAGRATVRSSAGRGGINYAEKTTSTSNIGQLSVNLTGANTTEPQKPKEEGFNPIGFLETINPLRLGVESLGTIMDGFVEVGSFIPSTIGTPRRRMERYLEEGDAGIKNRQVDDLMKDATGQVNIVEKATKALFNDDPKYLSDQAKAMLSSGADYEEVWQYMKKNSETFSANVVEDLAASIIFDPLNLNPFGKAVKFAGKVGKTISIATEVGRSFDEVAAATKIGGKPAMNKVQIGIAKRLGFLGKAYDASTRVGAASLEPFRGPAVAAVSDVLGIENIAQVSDDLDVLVPSSGKNFREKFQTGLLQVMHAASRAPIAKNASENARAWAESLFEVARAEGIDGLRRQDGLVGLPDEFYQKYVQLARQFEEYGQTEEGVRALQQATDELIQAKNLSLLGEELRGPILRDPGKNLPIFSRMRRAEVLAAGRADVITSASRHHTPVARAFDSGTRLSQSEYGATMLRTFVAAVGDNADGVVAREYAKKLDAFNDAYNKANSLDARANVVRAASRFLEIMRVTKFGDMIPSVREVQKLGGAASKVTVVTGNSFSRTTLTETIQTLERLIEDQDISNLKKFVTDLVADRDELSRRYDSLVFGKAVDEDPVAEARVVLKTLKDMLASGAYVSRLSDDLLNKLRILEEGPVGDLVAKADEASTAALTEAATDAELAANTFLNKYTFAKLFPGIEESHYGFGHDEYTRSVTIETAINNGGDNIYGSPAGLSLELSAASNDGVEWAKGLGFRAELVDLYASGDLERLRRTEEGSSIGRIALQEAFSPVQYDKLNDFQRAILQNGIAGDETAHVATLDGDSIDIPLTALGLKPGASINNVAFATVEVLDGNSLEKFSSLKVFDKKWVSEWKDRGVFTYVKNNPDAKDALKWYNMLEGLHVGDTIKGKKYLVRVTNGAPIASMREWLNNKIDRVLHQNSSTWFFPQIKATRVNADSALNKFKPEAIALEEMGGGANLLIQDIDDVILSSGDFDVLENADVFIPRTLKEIATLDIKSRISLIFDPATIARQIAFNASPAAEPLDLRDIVIHTEKYLDGGEERFVAKHFTKLMSLDRYEDIVQPVNWSPSQNALSDPDLFIKEWLKDRIQGLVNLQDSGQVTYAEIFPDLPNVNIDEPNVDDIVETIYQYYEAEFGDTFTTAVLTSMNEIDAMRVGFNENLKNMGSKKFVTLAGGNRAFSWADLLHNLDASTGIANQNIKGYMEPLAWDFIKEKNTALTDYLISAPAGGIGPHKVRLFDVLSNPEAPESITAALLMADGQLNTEQEVLEWLYSVGKPTSDMVLPMVYKQTIKGPVQLHLFAEEIGALADGRIRALTTSGGIDLQSEAYGVDTANFLRVFNPAGKPHDAVTYVTISQNVPTNAKWFTTKQMAETFLTGAGFENEGRFLQIPGGYGLAKDAAKVAQERAQLAAQTANIGELLQKQAAVKTAQKLQQEMEQRQALYDSVKDDPTLQPLLNLQRKARSLGYDLGTEPAKGYLEGVQIIRDVRGIPVIRPRYDLYTSLGEYFEPADYGIKQLDQLAVRPSLKTKLQQFASTPISNNELYDASVERLRIFLGARITRDQSVRAMAEIVQAAINQDINPGGLTNTEIEKIFLDVFGGGEKASRTFNRVFGSTASPRSALLYALANDPGKIGYSTAVSKRVQERFPTMSTIAQKLFPLSRYRYNPQFNQQEGIEPFALTVLRGIKGARPYEEASQLSSLLSAPGSFRYDSHEVGAHILRHKASIADSLSRGTPEIEGVVEKHVARQLLDKAADTGGFLLATGDKQRLAIAASKVDAIDVTAADEFKRSVMEEFASNFPEIRTIAWNLTKSTDPADWFDYLITSQVNATIPQQVLRVGEVSARSFTYGAPVRTEYADVIQDLLKRDDLTPDDLAELDDIVTVAEKTGASSAAQDELIAAFRKFKTSVRFIPKQTIAKAVAGGGSFQGETAFTTLDNITDKAKKAIGSWVHGSYSSLSRYLAAKAEFGVQKTSLVKDENLMKKIASQLSGSFDGVKYYDDTAVGDARFAGMDAWINSLDELIKSNRISVRSSIYRALKLEDILPDPAAVQVGDVFGMENISAWSRRFNMSEAWSGGETLLVVDNAKGLPGFDIAGAKLGIGSEDEILLPRGIQVRVVSITTDNRGQRIMKVDVLLQPDLQLAMDRLAPDDAARIGLQKAYDTLQIEQEQVRRSEAALTKLFEAYPAILDDAKRAGTMWGDEPTAVRTIRQKRRKGSVIQSSPQGVDVSQFGVQYSRSAPRSIPQTASRVLDEKIVFANKVGKATSGMNQGGDTGIWVGADGIKRYAKLAGTGAENVSAALNEFLTAELYRKMGVIVPDVSLSVRGGQLYVVSTWQEGIVELGQNGFKAVDQDVAKQFLDNHVADVLLNNWDAVGPDGMNAGILPDGTVVRIDVGGSGRFRAGGGFKPIKQSEIVDLSAWWNPDVLRGATRPAAGYRKIIDRAYPELAKEASTLDIPSFVEQYDDMLKELGSVQEALADSVSKIADDLISTTVIDRDFIAREAKAYADLVEKRIAQLDVTVDKLRRERILLAESAAQATTGGKVSKPLPKLKIRKADPWTDVIVQRLAGQMNDGYRLPGLEAAMLAVESGQLVNRVDAQVLGRGLAQYLYERKAVTDFVDWARAAHARSVEVATKEQLYNPNKSALERTLNHPFTGFYPTSYTYGKILPVFANALFKYSPFSGEYAPFVGARRLNIIAEHIAAALEDNPDLQEVVMKRTPLINYLNSLVPGVPSDIGAGLPYWFRNGILRPAVEGNFEDIPGKFAESVLTTGERIVGPLNYARTVQSSITQIQTMLTGDSQTSVLEEISDFLIPGAGN